MTRRVLIQTDRYRLTYLHRRPKEDGDRFGGGWQWCVGVQVGRRTVLVNLLVCSLRLGPRPRCTAATYNRFRVLAKCELPAGHTGKHTDGEFTWGSHLNNPRRAKA